MRTASGSSCVTQLCTGPYLEHSCIGEERWMTDKQGWSEEEWISMSVWVSDERECMTGQCVRDMAVCVCRWIKRRMCDKHMTICMCVRCVCVYIYVWIERSIYVTAYAAGVLECVCACMYVSIEKDRCDSICRWYRPVWSLLPRDRPLPPPPPYSPTKPVCIEGMRDDKVDWQVRLIDWVDWMYW